MTLKLYDGCEECQHRGFLHMHEPFEIERCDACAPEEFTDDDAIELHRIRCGCDWPEQDYRHALWRSFDYRIKDEGLRETIDTFRAYLEANGPGSANTVEGLASDIGYLAILAKEILIAFQNRKIRAANDIYVFRNVEWVAVTLDKLIRRLDENKLPLHWFWPMEKGTYNKENDTWAARRPSDQGDRLQSR